MFSYRVRDAIGAVGCISKPNIFERSLTLVVDVYWAAAQGLGGGPGWGGVRLMSSWHISKYTI